MPTPTPTWRTYTDARRRKARDFKALEFGARVLYLPLAHSVRNYLDLNWRRWRREIGMAIGVIMALTCALYAWCIWASIPFASALWVCAELSASLCAILRYELQ